MDGNSFGTKLAAAYLAAISFVEKNLADIMYVSFFFIMAALIAMEVRRVLRQ